MSTPQSRLDELRSFRMNGHSSSNSDIPNKLKVSAGRKRIRVVSDSSDDGEATQSTNNTQHNGSDKKSLTTNEREERLANLRKLFPSQDLMEVQDELIRNNWDVEKASERLKHKKSSPHKISHSSSHRSTHSSHSHSSHSSHSSPHSKKSHHQVIILHKIKKNRIFLAFCLSI